MKKIIGILFIFLLLAFKGYCEDQPLQLTIKSDKEVYGVGEEIKFTLEVKNVGDETYKKEGIIVAEKDNDEKAVVGLSGKCTIYGIDKDGNNIYRLTPPSLSNKYFAEWSDLIIESGKSYKETILLKEDFVRETGRYVLVDGGELTVGQHNVLVEFEGFKSNIVSFKISWLNLMSLKAIF